MTQSSNPLVSIVMPAHNAGPFIGQAVDSVLSQTYPHWELIIVDDASTDNTEEVMAAYTDPRIRYLPVSRIGSPAGVRNHGLRLVGGEFVTFLDADDRYYDHTLETLLRQFETHPERTAVYGFPFRVDEFGEPTSGNDLLIPTSPGYYHLPENYRHTWDFIVRCQISCLLPALMIRRSTLDRVGLFNENYYSAEDYEYYVRLFLDNFDGVACIPAYLYQYRVYAGSLTKRPEHYNRILLSCLRLMNWLFNDAGLPEEAQASRSLAYTGCYRYLARERIIHHQGDLGRHIALSALYNPNIKAPDWIAECLPLIVRSFIPPGMHHALIQCRSWLKYQRARLRLKRHPAI